jgi:hypothetical protein
MMALAVIYFKLKASGLKFHPKDFEEPFSGLPARQNMQ